MKWSAKAKRINLIFGIVFICLTIWSYFSGRQVNSQFPGYWVTQKRDVGYVLSADRQGYELTNPHIFMLTTGTVAGTLPFEQTAAVSSGG